MKKKNPVLLIVILMLLIISTVLLIYHRNESIRRSNTVIKTAPLVEALGYRNTDVYFPKKKATVLGRSAYQIIQNDDAFRIYADPKTGEVFYIKGNSGSGPALSDEDLRAKKDAIVAAVKGEDILQLCRERAEAEGTSGDEYKCYIDDVSVSVANVLLNPDGSVNTVIFQNTAVPESPANAIAKEDAVAAAKKEAESFLKKKNCLEGSTLDESRTTAEKVLSKDKVVWRVELYYRPDSSGVMDYYFDISVNPKNGRIIENANNLS